MTPRWPTVRFFLLLPLFWFIDIVTVVLCARGTIHPPWTALESLAGAALLFAFAVPVLKKTGVFPAVSWLAMWTVACLFLITAVVNYLILVEASGAV